MKKIFDYEIVEKSIGIKWWEKILLWFCTPKYGFDWGEKDGDKSVMIEAKTLFGKIYITREIEAE